MTGTSKAHKAVLRPVRSEDVKRLAQLDQSCSGRPWSSSDFSKMLDRKLCHGFVAEVSGQMIGFIIYESKRRSVQIMNIAVILDARRQKVATKLVAKLRECMKDSKHKSIRAEVRESDVEAQMFLKSCNFKAVKINKCHFKDTQEDMYSMEASL